MCSSNAQSAMKACEISSIMSNNMTYNSFIEGLSIEGNYPWLKQINPYL